MRVRQKLWLSCTLFFFFYQWMQRCTLSMYAESFLFVEFWMQHSRFYGSNVATCWRLFHTSYRAGESAVASCQGRPTFLHMCTSHCVGTHMGAWHAQHRVLERDGSVQAPFFGKSLDGLKTSFIPYSLSCSRQNSSKALRLSVSHQRLSLWEVTFLSSRMSCCAINSLYS